MLSTQFVIPEWLYRVIHTRLVIPEWFYRGSGLVPELKTIFPIGTSGMTLFKDNKDIITRVITL